MEQVESVQMKLDNFVPFGRPPSGKVIIQDMADFLFLITKYRDNNNNFVYRNRSESKEMRLFL